VKISPLKWHQLFKARQILPTPASPGWWSTTLKESHKQATISLHRNAETSEVFFMVRRHEGFAGDGGEAWDWVYARLAEYFNG